MRLFLLIVFALALPAFSSEFWQEASVDTLGDSAAAPIQPQRFRAYRFDIDDLERSLAEAPAEGAALGLQLTLPRPDGQLETFSAFYSPIMEKPLADRYPEIRTYLVRSRSGSSRGRIDVTPKGFHAMIRGPLGTWFMDPYVPGNRDSVISYFKKDYTRSDNDFSCLVDDVAELDLERPDSLVPIEGELLTYRCAIACTGEYATFHGGTVQLVLAEMVTALNRVDEVYEDDLAIRMILVANNDLLIYLNAGSDPYTNNSGSAMLGENQTNVTAVIGAANYDIGHVFSTGGGGVASLGVVCNNSSKARGVTGLTNPIGDAFYIDYVAHEMGHQWRGNHTFNGSTGSCSGGNRNGSTAYEPGSGSTIMAYAGICSPQNLQNNSDPYFHGVSYDEIVNFSRVGNGSTCGTPLVVANQAPESVEAGPNYTIPAQTPFELTGSAIDNDGDTLYYCWEQFDLGPAGGITTDPGTGPIFRSWNPTTDPVRTLPRLSNLLTNTVPTGEVMPTTTRTLTFRLTVRDYHAGGGGVDFDTMQIQVTNTAGPFLVTAPNTALTWAADDTETVTWNVAGTTAAPISCANVDILLSLDGGLTYPTVLAAGVANDGSASIVVPNVDTSQARVKVICSDNIFFDISNADFTITPTLLACPTEWSDWGAATAGVYLDTNGNGIVDIIDLIFCP